MNEHHQLILIIFLHVMILFGNVSRAEPSIVSSQTEIIAYANYTAKFSCIVENRRDEFVTWSRVERENQSEKLLNLLFVNTHKYTPSLRYHLTHSKNFWNLEIRHVHPSDQGHYSCVVSGAKKISQLFFLKILSTNETVERTNSSSIDSTRNPSLTLRSTADFQRRNKFLSNNSKTIFSTFFIWKFSFVVQILFLV